MKSPSRLSWAAFLLLAVAVKPASSAEDSAAEISGNDLLCANWGCAGGSVTGSASSWHGSADGDFGDNQGPALGLDVAAPVPGLQDFGVGVQASAGEGWFDSDGTGSSSNQVVQRQTLLSLGFFRRPSLDGEWWTRFGIGGAYDVSLNHGAGTDSDAYTVRQFRGKASYSISGGHEAGFWFTEHIRTDSISNNGNVNLYRAADQLNFFYKYSFATGGHVGVFGGPGRADLMGPRRISQPTVGTRQFKYTMGADASAPLSDYAAVYGGFEYARPTLRNRMGDEGVIRRTYNLSAGLRVFWGGNARTREDSGRHWMPYLPDVDNGNFMTVSNLDN